MSRKLRGQVKFSEAHNGETSNFEVNKLVYVLIYTICCIRLAMTKPVGRMVNH